jgi:hypothetical protein
LVPIQDIKPEEIRGVLYLDRITKGQIEGVRFFFVDGTSHTYDGDDLAKALEMAKERFRPEPDPTSISDQQSKE